MAAREPLSTERVLRAALELADSGGTDGLTMRGLGQELGVEAMSLYKHVANKDAILDGIVDLVVGEIALPSPGDDWKQSMRRRGISAHEVLLRHPWACRLLMSRPNVGPAMLRYVDSTVGTLRQAGFSIELADHAWNAMDSHVYGFTLQKLTFPFEPQQYPEKAGTYLPQLPLAGTRTSRRWPCTSWKVTTTACTPSRSASTSSSTASNASWPRSRRPPSVMA